MANAKSAVADEMNDLRVKLPLLYSKALEIMSSLHDASGSRWQRLTGKDEHWNSMCKDLNRQHARCNQIASEAEEKMKNCEKNKKILDWIADPDPNVQHISIKKDINLANPSAHDVLLCPDGLPPYIGDWFIATEEFQAWAQSTRRTSEDAKGPTFETMVRALCHQLSWSSVGIRTPAAKLYDISTSGSNKSPLIEQWVELLKELLTLADRPVILVVDALDECKDKKDQLSFLALIKSLHSSFSRLHIFFSSRGQEEPSNLLMSYIQTFEARSQKADADMDRFIRGQLKQRKSEDPASEYRHKKMAKKLLDRLENFANHASEIPQLEKINVAYKSLWDTNAEDYGSGIQERIFRLVLCTFRPLKPDQLLQAVRFNPQDPDDYEDKLEMEGVQRRYHKFLSTDSKGFLQFEHISAKVFVLEMKERSSNIGSVEKAPKVFSESRNHQFMAEISIKMLQNPTHQLWDGSGINLLDWETRLRRTEEFETVRDEIRKAKFLNSKIQVLDFRIPGLAQICYPRHFAHHVMTDWTRHCRLIEPSNSKLIKNMKPSKLPGLQGWCSAVAIMNELAFWRDINKLATRAMDSLIINGEGDVAVDLFLWVANFGNSPFVIDEQELRRLAAIANEKHLTSIRGQTPLYIACCCNNQGIAKLILEEGASMDIDHGSHGTALHVVSVHGYLEGVRLLLGQGADIDAKRKRDNATALYLASMAGHLKVVQILLEAGANGDMKETMYGRALISASAKKRFDLVKVLIEAGANVNQESDFYSSALQAASEKGHLEIMRLLIEAGADVNQEWNARGTALQAAAGAYAVEAVKMLIEVGADVNQEGGIFGSALHAATWWSSAEIVKVLINAGANVNLLSWQPPTTVLSIASEKGELEIMKLLIDAGADVNAEGGGDFRTALEAAQRAPQNTLEAVKLLIQAGAR
ncbi:hypothetical protein H2200_008488 [Cladophialophora chaetospira]|uniref:Nephrocystin 3-like N-terminal domain-containing protein n=1 Tax=Cladophialophora chaetospira TaxID=386627 RepID=A0AA38X5V3_9EURO|nr:hypothetical protein H2200_008488 [Cladophialophora chaetospira]